MGGKTVFALHEGVTGLLKFSRSYRLALLAWKSLLLHYQRRCLCHYTVCPIKRRGNSLFRGTHVTKALGIIELSLVNFKFVRPSADKKGADKNDQVLSPLKNAMSTLQALDLRSVFPIQEGVAILFETVLTTLGVSRVDMTDNGCTELCTAVANAQSMKHFGISYNKFCNPSAAAIASVVERCRSQMVRAG